MDTLRELVGVSFKDVEQGLWHKMLHEFAGVLTAVLESMDEVLLEARDKDRFETRDFQQRSIDTLFGTGVDFQRRRYYDREKKKHVYLLDEALGLVPREQLSPGLKAAMLTQAVTTSSYRKAAESLTSLLGFPAVSHESIRQAVIEVGTALEAAGAEEREDPQGDRQVDVIFLEADGMHISLQQEQNRSVEEKVLTTHEGWEPRHPSSAEFALVNVDQFRTNDADFWEAGSRHVYSRYDITEDTLVVLNGDRAKWIRKGVKYFPQAMYQIDQFHLKRDIRRLFRSIPEQIETLFEALDGDDVTGATFLARLAEATAKLTDKKRRDEATRLLRDLSDIPEATVDYRRRMKARGLCTEGLRGLGAAESQIDRLSDRLKGRGRSWRHEGEAAMMELQCARNNGRFEAIVDRIEEWREKTSASVVPIKETVRRAARTVKSALAIPQGKTPIDSSGTNASGGLSNLLHRINESQMPS